jgi:hypothetical protein
VVALFSDNKDEYNCVGGADYTTNSIKTRDRYKTENDDNNDNNKTPKTH